MKEKRRQTWRCIRCRLNAAEINGRTYTWMKEWCKPCEGRKVEDAGEQQPEALDKYKQVHRVTRQEERNSTCQ